MKSIIKKREQRSSKKKKKNKRKEKKKASCSCIGCDIEDLKSICTRDVKAVTKNWID